jgi:hypothetical protein
LKDDTELEHNAESPEKHAVAPQDGAESGAVSPSRSTGLPSELTAIIAKWLCLPSAVQAEYLTIIRASCELAGEM